MPEIRINPVSGNGVIIAGERAHRPFQNHADKSSLICPFCVGNEHQTPESVDCINYPQTEQWAVRSVPNRYAALNPVVDPWTITEFQVDRGTHTTPLYWQRESANGLHEVIIESPQHVTQCGQLDLEQWKRVIRFYAQRIRHAYSDPRWQYVQLFKNQGAQAGASMTHIHSQLMAMPLIPPVVRYELGQIIRHSHRSGKCVWCMLIQTELQMKARIVAETPYFIVFCPFASRFAGETWIIPRIHRPDMENESEAIFDQLAEIVSRLIPKMEAILPTPSFNIIYRNAPRIKGEIPGLYHWRVEIVPRINSIAGFEIGTGYFINVIQPEEFAEKLRKE